MQLVFGRDTILNIQHTADWNRTEKRKQKFIKQNNIQENAKWIKQTYNIGNKIFIAANLRDPKYDKNVYGTISCCTSK